MRIKKSSLDYFIMSIESTFLLVSSSNFGGMPYRFRDIDA